MSATARHEKAAALRAENDRLRRERNAGITANAELIAEVERLAGAVKVLSEWKPEMRDAEIQY